jgi:hypothetical protein
VLLEELVVVVLLFHIKGVFGLREREIGKREKHGN